MKLRNSKIKIQHGLIDGLGKLLQQISLQTTIKSIIPGRIKPVKGTAGQLKLYYTVGTDSGIKLIAKTGRAVQEVFVVLEGNTKESLDILIKSKLIYLNQKDVPKTK